MKIATKDLQGAALDWAVATSQGWTRYPEDSIETGSVWHHDPTRTPFGPVSLVKNFKPSTDWSQAGPIIERERICINAYLDTADFNACTYTSYKARQFHLNGPTPLIAAMRSYVASRLGDSVDVPDNLNGD